MKKSFAGPEVNLTRDKISLSILSFFSMSGFTVTGTKASDAAGTSDSISAGPGC
ncbi:MAG TPA: hypothetical protein VGK38_01385 [Prolixibacteraceae bacterium]|jgi:hypothetical protein